MLSCQPLKNVVFSALIIPDIKLLPTAAACADPYPSKMCSYFMILVIRGGFCPHFTVVTYVLLQMPPHCEWLPLSSTECEALEQIWFVLFKSQFYGSFPHKAAVWFVQLLSIIFFSSHNLKSVTPYDAESPNPTPLLRLALPWQRPEMQAVDPGHYRVFMTRREQLRAPALWMCASCRMRALLCC